VQFHLVGGLPRPQRLIVFFLPALNPMTNNAVYVVISEGRDLYSAMTRISVASLRVTNPAFKVLMACDAATVAAMTHRRDPLLDEVDQWMTCEVGDGSSDYRNRYIKTNLRNLINGRFLFLDSDTLIRGKLDEVFALDSDIACARNNSKELVEQQIIPQDVTVLRRMEWQTRKDAYFNSGVFFCNDTPGARRFVEDWRRKWSESNIRMGNYRDQPAFNAAIFDTNVRLAILPHRFNAQVKYEVGVAEGAAIWHFYASMRLPITAFEILAKELSKGIEFKSSDIESIILRNHPWRRVSWVDDLAVRRVLKKGGFDSEDHLWFQGHRASSLVRRIAKGLPFIKDLVLLVRSFRRRIHCI
jgi:Glycosyl transferase family 8